MNSKTLAVVLITLGLAMMSIDLLRGFGTGLAIGGIIAYFDLLKSGRRKR